MMRYFLVAATLAQAVRQNAASPRPHVVLDAKGNVARFYGVPIRLTISELKRLPYRLKIKQEYCDEEYGAGEQCTKASITADDGVQVKVAFDSNGKLSGAGTTSPNAVGPKAIGVGSSLSYVRAAWPGGRLLYGAEENQAFVTFVTGTNVQYFFDPQDMQPGTFLHPGSMKEVPSIRVQRIEIFDHPIAIPDACVPGYCL